MANLDELKQGDRIKNDEWVEGEKVVIVDGGKFEMIDFKKGEGPKKCFVVSVLYKGIEREVLMNKTSRDSLSQSWSTDTNKWVDKVAVVKFVSMAVGGKKLEVVDLTPTDEKSDQAEVRTRWEEEG